MDMFANPSALFADVLLPASTCWEHEALMPGFRKAQDAATWAQFREAVVQPLHETRSDLEVIFDLATRMGLGDDFFGGDIRAAFNYELAPSGLTVQQLRDHQGGMRAEGQTRYQKYSEINAETGRPRGFQTPSGKVEIYSTAFARAGYAALPLWAGPVESHAGPSSTAQDYPLVLTFARLVQFCDEQHRNIPRLRRQAPHPLLEIHPSTAAALCIQDGEWVLLETATGTVQLMANFNSFLDPRVVSTQYGWWQGCRELDLPAYDPFGSDGANANLLISNAVVDPISGSVQHRSVKCRVRKKDYKPPNARACTLSTA
jgi:anaerobic selenocysteine-containing dehydrogenase